MPTLPTWLCISAGSILIAAGAWLIFNGNLLRRKLRTHHCRKCGYSMAGLPTLTCPECGRTARNILELSTKPPRRSWRLAGTVSLALGVACLYTPTIQRTGWIGALPDWAIALCTPLDAPATSLTGGTAFPLNPAFVARLPAVSTTPDPDRSISDRFYDEFERRVRTNELSDGALAHYLQRVYNLLPGERSATLETPTQWPSDTPFYLDYPIRTPHKSPIYAWCKCELVESSAGHSVVRYTVSANTGRKTLTVCIYERPIDTSRRAAEFMRPVTSPELDAAVLEAIDPRIRIDPDSLQFIFDRRQNTPIWDHIPHFVAYSISVSVDGRVVGEAECGTSRIPCEGKAFYGVSLNWREGGEAAVRANPQSVRITLTGKPAQCIDDFVYGGWRYPTTAWAGTVTVTPRIDPNR